MMRGQVEYALIYVAAPNLWKKYQPTFLTSARSFQFLPSPNLSHVVLKGNQIGHGYKLAAFPGGTSFIGEPTLDLCAGSFPSETLRTGRLQVEYTHPKKTVSVSNEVVTYVTGGAPEALKEVTHVAKSCSSKSVVKKADGITTIYKTTPLSDPKLPPGTVSVKIIEKQSKGKQHVTSRAVAIYQIKGNTLSGVYVFVDKGTTFADAERVAFHAAEQSLRNLGGSPASGSSGTGGGSGSGSGKSGSTGSKGFVA
jgi:hypothetical protein